MKHTWWNAAKDPSRDWSTGVILLLTCLSVGGSLLSSWTLADRHAVWPGVLPSILAGASLFWHRSHPRAVIVVTTFCAMAQGALGYLLNPLAMTPLIAALYSLGIRADRRTVRNWSLAAAVCVVCTDLLLGPGGHPVVLSLVNPVAWAFLPAALGSYVRMRRAYVAEAHARAEYAERTREDEARYRVAQERLRIARDLHDVVAHHLTLASAQAAVAAHLARTQPQQALPALDYLAGATSSALFELKAAVGLLRQDTDDDSSLGPAPSLDRLHELTDGMAATGFHVDLRVEGGRRPIPSTVDVTAYRILQEALTNASKYAQKQTACVRLVYAPDQLTLMVRNDVPATTAPLTSTTGFGLISMRERALSVGGVLDAGPRPDGGFDVTCVLPLDPTSPQGNHLP
ncbi:sensor histidine kinase [Streptomyces sp. NPDC057690]|uniref:sensor histidine kinase n=1 Tax=Streptomyces sp. NPDC057690 TaxID=3346214 RepID=UPI0036975727